MLSINPHFGIDVPQSTIAFYWKSLGYVCFTCPCSLFVYLLSLQDELVTCLNSLLVWLYVSLSAIGVYSLSHWNWFSNCPILMLLLLSQLFSFVLFWHHWASLGSSSFMSPSLWSWGLKCPIAFISKINGAISSLHIPILFVLTLEWM